MNLQLHTGKIIQLDPAEVEELRMFLGGNIFADNVWMDAEPEDMGEGEGFYINGGMN
jgi:hypothetical protein